MGLELEMRKLRTLTKDCVMIEASRNPSEFLCTIGWHHRGLWFQDLQTSADTVAEALSLAKKKWLKKKEEK